MRRLVLLVGTVALLSGALPAHAQLSLETSYVWRVAGAGEPAVAVVICEARASGDDEYVPAATTVGCSLNGVGRETTLPGGYAVTVVTGVFPRGIIVLCRWARATWVAVSGGSSVTVDTGPSCGSIEV